MSRSVLSESITACCSVLQCVVLTTASHVLRLKECVEASVLQCVAVCCSVLQWAVSAIGSHVVKS